MRVINRYLLHDYLVIFSVTLVVFTFVLCIGAVIKAIDLMARGVSLWLILRAFSYNIPFTMMFSVPMSCMTTVLLLFGRLSMDGELTALRASGLSMWQVISPIVLAAIFLSGFCLYLTASLGPHARFARRQALMNVGIEDPISLLEEGRFVRDFPGLMIYIESKRKNEVKDVVVYEMDSKGKGVKRSVRAHSGTLTMVSDTMLQVDLYDVRIDQPEDEHRREAGRTRTIYAKHYPVPLDFSEMMRQGNVSKKKADMTLLELIALVHEIDVGPPLPDVALDDLAKHRMSYVVEANERIALSLSCFAFTLLGIPLGMKSRRRESSVGIAISLLVIFGFYFFIIVADSLVRYPDLRPDLIIWIPVLLCELAGFYLIKKMD